MLRYIRTRLLAMIPVLVGMSILVFVTMRLIPGDVAVVFLGTKPTPEAIAAFRAKTGLDQPMYVQYFDWIGRLFHGDVGISLTTGTDIKTELLNRLPITAELTFLSMFIAVLIAVPLGILAALNHNKGLDRSRSRRLAGGRTHHLRARGPRRGLRQGAGAHLHPRPDRGHHQQPAGAVAAGLRAGLHPPPHRHDALGARGVAG